MKFLYPEVNENRCIDGIVSCELPLTPYLSAALYKVFSYDEFWFRLLSFVFFSLGMFALFLWLKTRMNSIVSFLLVCLLQCSPILMFYAANFLPDITALGLSLMALYLFTRLYLPHPYLPNFKSKWIEFLLIACLSFAVASKTTTAIHLLSLMGIVGLSFIKALNIHIVNRKRAISVLLLSCFIPLVWYFWSKHLAATHNSQYFMMRIPIPDKLEDYKTAWLIYLANWPQQTFSEPLIFIFSGALLLPLFLKRFISNELFYLSVINLIGSVAFLFLMIDQFKYHDYYIICLMPAFVLNWLALSEAIQKLPTKMWYIKVATLFALVWMFSIQYNGGTTNLRERYTPGNYWEQSHLPAESYDSLKHQLIALGIDRNQCVVAGVDPAPNNMLYFLHLRGHRYSPEHDSARMDHIINGSHPKYLISNDSLLEVRISNMIDSMTFVTSQGKIKVFELHH